MLSLGHQQQRAVTVLLHCHTQDSDTALQPHMGVAAYKSFPPARDGVFGTGPHLDWGPIFASPSIQTGCQASSYRLLQALPKSPSSQQAAHGYDEQ